MKCPKCKGRGHTIDITNYETLEHKHLKCLECNGTGSIGDLPMIKSTFALRLVGQAFSKVYSNKEIIFFQDDEEYSFMDVLKKIEELYQREKEAELQQRTPE